MTQEMEMMNCEDYKLAQGADPTFDGGVEHLAACEECRSYRDELQVLNGKIAQALKISVPELKLPELPELDAAKVTLLADRRTVSKPVWFAIAASVLLAAFIGVRFASVDGQVSVADQVLAHIDHEPFALRSVRAVSDRRLARVVPANIATMNHDTGLITYAQSCKINGNDVPHLVLQGENGPITILLMPNEAVSETTAIDGESVSGYILSVGSGSIAIIGEKDEELEYVKQNVMKSVKWST